MLLACNFENEKILSPAGGGQLWPLSISSMVVNSALTPHPGVLVWSAEGSGQQICAHHCPQTVWVTTVLCGVLGDCVQL